LKQNQRLIINILTLLIILVGGLGISNLLVKYFSRENSSPLVQDTFLLTKEEIISEGEESAEEVFRDNGEPDGEAVKEDSISSDEEKDFVPKIAFIIDDLGYERQIAQEIIELDFPVALSILPYLTYSEYLAEEGKKNSQEIILHLPLEAHNSDADPGPGAIKSYMSEEEIREAVRKALSAVPYILGVNNHMGSKITENRAMMEIILEEIGRYNLFFIDSLTSENSIAYKIAQEMGIKTAARSVFLDNENDLDYIKGQMEEAQRIAFKKGEAIVIGHSRINTFYALKRMVPELIKAGIEVVPVSELVR